MSRFRHESRVTLLSNDSDLLQFVADDVAVATYVGVGKGPNGWRIKPWSSADVFAKFGVHPANVAAFKALCGETGDDIPGVPSIGKGTAVKLLRRWQTLEKALEASEFVSHRDETAKLAPHHAHARLMLELTTLRQDVPLPTLTLAQLAIASIAWPDGSTARGASVGTASHTQAGPGLEDVPWPES
jgi:DNA polymerase-1